MYDSGPNSVFSFDRSFFVHSTKARGAKGCFLSYRVMADSKLPPVEDSLHGPKNVGQSDPESMIREDADSVYVSLDPTYVAKATILNDALREIGMGKYQVGSA